MTAAPIEDHAIVGDCASAALVTRGGTVDWLCWPQFDSDPVFGSLLDPAAGHWTIAPAGDAEVTRRYLPGTAVLETTFVTGRGTATLTDAMMVDPRDEFRRTVHPDHELLRVVRCDDGEVELDVEVAPRFRWGRGVPRFEHRPGVGHVVSRGREVMVLRAEADLRDDGEGCLRGALRLSEGDRARFMLAYDVEEPAVLPLTGEAADRALDRTVEYWEQWSSGCDYGGPHRDAVLRSAITVKLLTYARSGAIVAAATTSLPEVPGGTANWDYRYCWLRDAAMSLRALFELGYVDEGRAFFDWLLYATRLEPGGLPVMYDVFGNADLTERTLDELQGYQGSRPVRVGNDAVGQFQLDMYGELVAAAHEYVQRGQELDPGQRKTLARLGHTICERWDEPDNGIWELRDSLRHHTYSKAMCWVGLQRLLELQDQGHLEGLPAARFERIRDEVHHRIEERGFDPDLGSYAATLDGRRLDASLLLLPVYGYCEGDSDRMIGTIEAIREHLSRGPLVYRFLAHDGGGGAHEPDEGAFVICSFWLQEALALAGRVDEAREQFDAMVGRTNDVGLFSEEIEVSSGRHLGNTPQAFSHVGLINAAITLQRLGRGQGRSDHDRRGDTGEAT